MGIYALTFWALLKQNVLLYVRKGPLKDKVKGFWERG